MAQRQLCLRVESETRAGGRDPAGGPLQQANGQFVFQACDLLAERRDADIKIKRGAPHAAGFNNAHKIA